VLGLETVGDLLEHLPHRHADRGEVRPIASLSHDEDATVEVEVRSITTRPSRNRRMRPRAEARVADESGPLVAVWFNQPWVADRISPGTRLLLRGRMKKRNQFWVTTYEQVDTAGAVHTVGVVSVYPGTKGSGGRRV